MNATKPALVLDVETYVNYFLVKFRHTSLKTYRDYELVPEKAMNADEIRTILLNYQIFTFNGRNYDMPMVIYALVLSAKIKRREITPVEANLLLKQASDHIIDYNLRGWQFEQQYEIKIPEQIDHIDLMEPAPGVMISLKQYGARMHMPRLQDLPIEPDAHITYEQRPKLRHYCGNDLDTTDELREWLMPQIELRENMTRMYGIDLRSKSDAQMAEAVLKSEIEKIIGRRLYKPDIRPGTRYAYTAPSFIQFTGAETRKLLDDIETAPFVIGPDGYVVEPPALKDRQVRIGPCLITLGIGGLHSNEKCTAHFADDATLLVDRDVASYYPAIIINCRLYPQHIGDAFLKVYKSILDRRIAAKRAGDKVTANSLKITVNGTFGKLGNKHSLLYSPDLMLMVTITGQLALLMLIESLWAHEIPVVQANTDGIVIKCPKSKKHLLDQCIVDWERATQFETEETQYRALFSRDVNSYIALKAKGGYKTKGEYLIPELVDEKLKKNPQAEICNIAACEYLDKGTPIEQTIIRCEDVRKFVVAQNVSGGGVKITRTRYDDSLTPAGQRNFLLAHGWQIVVPGTVAQCRLVHASFMDTTRPMDVATAYRVHCGEDSFEYLGKVVRWVYAYGETGDIRYRKKNKAGNRNKVPSSDGAMPVMDLPDHVPVNLDYGRYIRDAQRILHDVGVLR